MSDDDLISRADAMDAFNNQIWNNINIPICKEIRNAVKNTIEQLPSAQPKIVRCKECKRWWGNHYHDNEDGKCPMDAWIDGDGFCSYGEREGE